MTMVLLTSRMFRGFPRLKKSYYIVLVVLMFLTYIISIFNFWSDDCTYISPGQFCDDKMNLIVSHMKQSCPQAFRTLPSNIFSKIGLDSPPSVPWLYLVTPTYKRPVQKAELTRLLQTFLNVPNLHWIVVEDETHKTKLVANLLKHSGLMYTHLNIRTSEDYQLTEKDPNWLKPRGVEQRNLGIAWLRENRLHRDGVVYFADDDNTYSLALFEEMRYTVKVSVWLVGLTGGLRFEGPVVKNGHVVQWHTMYKKNRPFPHDMAGFAVNLKLLTSINPTPIFDITVPRGYIESSLLIKLVTSDELEPKGSNCTEVLVWHTRTAKVDYKHEMKLIEAGLPSDPMIEV